MNKNMVSPFLTLGVIYTLICLETENNNCTIKSILDWQN